MRAARVGASRAARLAGWPAIAPMAMVWMKPADGRLRDDHLALVLGRGVHVGGGDADGDTLADPAKDGQDHCLGKKLPADVCLGRAESSSQSDLASPFNYRDHHHVGDADAANQQRHGAEAEEEGGQRIIGRRLGLEHLRSTHTDLLGVLWVSGRREDVSGLVDRTVDHPGVEHRRSLVESQKLDRRLLADDDGPVEISGERKLLEYAYDSDIVIADEHIRRLVETVDPEAFRSDRAHDGVWIGAGTHVEEYPIGEFPIERVEKALVGGHDLDTAGLAFWDELIPVNVCVHRPDRTCVGHRWDPLDRRQGVLGERRVATSEPGPGFDGQQVASEWRRSCPGVRRLR